MINIRQINTEDYNKIYNVIRDSFYNLYRPGCDEHYLCSKIFESDDYLSQYSLLIELDNEIIGCVIYTKAQIITENDVVDVVSFGPIAILPQHQRKKYGMLLIEASIDLVKNASEKAIVIMGYEHHYHPYGFVGGKKYQISMPDYKYYVGLLALVFDNSTSYKGYVKFSNVFDINEVDVEAFDLKFIKKEKKVLPSQAIFNETVIKIDERDYNNEK